MPAAVSVEEEIPSPGSMPKFVEMLGAQSLPLALNGDPFDVIRKHDSRPCAEEHTNGQQRRKQAERKHL